MGCKRILLSDDYYPGARAAQRRGRHRRHRRGPAARHRRPPTASSGRSTRSSSAPASGRPTCRSPRHIRGRDGRTLREVWAGSPQAHLGTTVAGFPNLFLLLGPNTGLGHTSVVYMIEAQIEHLVGALRFMRAPRRGRDRAAAEAQAEYVAGAGPPHARHRLGGRRLRELVPRPDRAQLDDVAGLHLALPPARRAVPSARVRRAGEGGHMTDEVRGQGRPGHRARRAASARRWRACWRRAARAWPWWGWSRSGCEALAAELGAGHAWFDVRRHRPGARWQRAVAGTVAALGGIDVVVANAGIASFGTVAVTPLEAHGPRHRGEPGRRAAHGRRRRCRT